MSGIPTSPGRTRDLDPTDLDPHGAMTRLKNDIFPDDLFTPGTRVEIFFKARYLAGGDWYFAPDTVGGNFYEYEVLPSSMDADGLFNCTLYVDHATDRGSRPWIEAGLASVLTGGSDNFENRAWDRYDVQAPSSQQASFGRPAEHGVRRHRAPGSGLPHHRLEQRGAQCVQPGRGRRQRPHPVAGVQRLRRSGRQPLPERGRHRREHDAGGAVRAQRAAAPERVLRGELHLRHAAGSLVSGKLGRAGHSRLHAARSGGRRARGGRRFPAVARSSTWARATAARSCAPSTCSTRSRARRGAPVGDEVYNAPVKGIISYASVTNETATYRTVVDGVSVHYRRDPSRCIYATHRTPEPAVAERLAEVLTWFGDTGSPAPCFDVATTVGVPDVGGPPPAVTRLVSLAPNPLSAGTAGTIRFTMAREGRATVEVFDVAGRRVRTVFDGVAGAGMNEATWTGVDQAGRAVAGGVYFCRLKADGEEFAQRLVVVRGR